MEFRNSTGATGMRSTSYATGSNTTRNSKKNRVLVSRHVMQLVQIRLLTRQVCNLNMAASSCMQLDDDLNAFLLFLCLVFFFVFVIIIFVFIYTNFNSNLLLSEFIFSVFLFVFLFVFFFFFLFLL